MNRGAANKKRSGRNRAGERPGGHRAALGVGFALGLAFGLALGAVAHFMRLNSVPSGIVAYGTQLMGHSDLAEDIIWLLSGASIGATSAAYAAWRANRRRANGIENEHVLNRTFRVFDGGPAADTDAESSRKGKAENRDRN